MLWLHAATSASTQLAVHVLALSQAQVATCSAIDCHSPGGMQQPNHTALIFGAWRQCKAKPLLCSVLASQSRRHFRSRLCQSLSLAAGATGQPCYGAYTSVLETV